MTRKLLLLIFSAAAIATSANAATDDISSDSFAKSVHREFGGIRHDYFFPGRVSDQIILGQGVPNPTKHLADGNYLVSGCRPHSCTEKTAMIATSAGTMLAAGMIYFSCLPEKGKRALDCKSVSHLKLFMKQKNNKPAFVQELQDWAVLQGYTGTAETQILR